MRQRDGKNALVWLLVSVAVIAVDQLSKAWVLRSLPEFTPVEVIPGFWNWFRTYNTGAAFSLLSDAGGWQKYLFLVFAVAIGHVIDRLVHGHVDDVIQWYVGRFYWPSFNIADAAIVVGVIGIVLAGLLPDRQAGAPDGR